MTTNVFESGGCHSTYTLGNTNENPSSYRCYVCLIREEDGVSAIVLNLPGVVSQGQSESEALENVREAISGVIEEYNSNNQEIPWTDSYGEIPTGKCKWILVNVG